MKRLLIDVRRMAGLSGGGGRDDLGMACRGRSEGRSRDEGFESGSPTAGGATGRGRKRRRAEEGGASQDMAEVAKATARKPKDGTMKSRQESSKDEAAIDASLREENEKKEMERRERQRMLQAAAREAHATGKEYISAKKLSAAARPPPKKIQVAVIPVYWSTEGREEEKAAVITYARNLMTKLEATGVVCRLDMRDGLKPSQKMTYWESRGVKVRLEVGPEELKAQKCVIAVPKGPGEVAHRTRVPAGDQVPRKVRRALRNLGVELGDRPTAGKADKGLEGKPEKALEVCEEVQKTSKKAKETVGVWGPAGGGGQAAVGGNGIVKGGSKEWVGGDDLGDDFDDGGDGLDDGEEDVDDESEEGGGEGGYDVDSDEDDVVEAKGREALRHLSGDDLGDAFADVGEGKTGDRFAD
eukprot:evm.model.scf_200EXC.2 EVM.evm.TU.scf_200EXC.2   scf_200EXC:9534-15894(-)